jgi:hypothetical protein
MFQGMASLKPVGNPKQDWTESGPRVDKDWTQPGKTPYHEPVPGSSLPAQALCVSWTWTCLPKEERQAGLKCLQSSDHARQPKQLKIHFV